MRVSELMTSEVVTVAPDESLKAAAKLLVEHRISGMPVCSSDGRVTGVISEGDILHKECGLPVRRGSQLAWLLGAPPALEVAKAQARTVREAMTTPAITITPNRPAAVAAELMVESAVNRLPVVTQDGRLVGIVTRADLVRAFARSDEDIAAEIREDVLRRALWVKPHTIDVTVRDGEVALNGELETRTDSEVLEKLVEKVPGVVRVCSSVTHRVDDTRRMNHVMGSW